MRLTCGDCRRLLTAYIHNELTPRARRQVDTHLNGCPSCSAAYAAQRRTALDLGQTLHSLGSPDHRQIGAVWAAVQSEISAVLPGTRTRKSARFPLRYGAVIIVMILALIAPTLMNRSAAYAQIPDPPTPLTNRVSETRVWVASPMLVALSAATIEPPVNGEAAATAGFQSNYAPTPGATDSP